MLALHDWQNFYMLTGTAAATLIGLLFVAVSISIGIDLTTKQLHDSLHTFVNPTLIYYIQALFISCLTLVPLDGPLIVGGVLIILGSINTLLALRVCYRMLFVHRDKDKRFDDWLWYFLLPLTAGLLCLCSAVGFLLMMPLATTGLCLTELLCLTVGLRNTWGLTTWMIIHRDRRGDRRVEEETTNRDTVSNIL